MKKKLLFLLIIMLAILIGMIFRSPYLRWDRLGEVEIEWVDFIKIDGEMYHLKYEEIENKFVKVRLDPNGVGEVIGSVNLN